MHSHSDADSTPLSAEQLAGIDAYWRAANYLSVGQLYLRDNPLLRQPLEMAHIKALVVGHWGTVPGLNLIYVHLNRAILKYDLDMIHVCGPGHGGAAVVAQVYLEGTWSEVYPEVTQDVAGLTRLFRQFSFPGGISSHVAPTTPGSIHEGGELGYSLSHAFGAVFDNPGLIAACVVGDGEAETGPLATAWHSNKLLNPVSDGAVLPILHLNGYKISNPTLLARIDPRELEQFFQGCGWTPIVVEGDDAADVHQQLAAAMDRAVEQILRIQDDARLLGLTVRPRWPVIVLRTPKGWTGPKLLDGQPVEGSFRSHQVPLRVDPTVPGHLALLENWLRSYAPQDLFDTAGRLHPALAALAPKGTRRMGDNPHANGGLLLRKLQLPEVRAFALPVATPGDRQAEDTRLLGGYLREVVRLNQTARNFRIVGPDETVSNLLGAVFEVTGRQWQAPTLPGDEFMQRDGMVLDAVLSEHQCQGWLEGYLLTGRHGLFHSYEAFIRIVDSMFSQHAKWLKVTREAALAAAHRVTELPAHLARLAAGPQRLHPPGPGLHRPRGQQEARDRARVPAARCQLPAADRRALPAQPQPRERGGRRQARIAAVADDGPGRRPLRPRHRHLGLGGKSHRRRHRRGHRARHRAGLLRRHAHAGGAGGRPPVAPAPARAEGPGRQRARPDDAAARRRAPARADRCGL